MATLPDYFYSKNPLRTRVESLDFGDGFLRWMNIVEGEGSEKSPRSQTSDNVVNTLGPYQDNDEGLVDCCDLEENYDITCTKSGKFMTSFYVPSVFHSVIIGHRGKQLRQFQDNTGTVIKVPKLNEQGDVRITGPNERSVASARSQISMLILNKREKMAVSHFVSIPVMSDVISDNFRIFKNEILNGPPTRGIEESIFQRPEKFHLTISTLSLADENEIMEAKKIIQNCYESVIQPLFPRNKKYRITLKGIEIMNDDPSDVDVLYGKVKLESEEETMALQKMANELVNYLSNKGLVRKQYENVKLHVTLMNSLFRKKLDNYEKHDGDKGKRESFDATHIIKNFSKFYFGVCVLENIQLSIRFSTSEQGYYQSALTLPF